MNPHVYFYLLILLTISTSVYAQKPKPRIIAAPDSEAIKIDTSSRRVPLNYYGHSFKGHSAETVFKNIKTLIAQNKLKGSAVYGKLTVDDYFVFADHYFNPVQYEEAVNKKDKNIQYNGKLWRLRPADEFPEPDVQLVTACGGGGMGSGIELPKVSDREELFTPFALSTSTTGFWQNNVLYLETHVPKTRRSDYKGSGVGVECAEIYVPLRQNHYVLSFSSPQPYRLFKASESIFSLDEYDYKKADSAGIVTWSGTDVIPGTPRYARPLFVVKLAPPYVRTKTFTVKDKVEGKMHVAVQNQLVGDLVDIWLYDGSTGEILANNAGDKAN
jgi:hypothetical protein